MMLGAKGLLPPTDAHEKFRFELLRSKLLPQFCRLLGTGSMRKNFFGKKSAISALDPFVKGMKKQRYLDCW